MGIMCGIAGIINHHADPDAVKAARKALEDRVLSEAKMIKKYINVPNTTPFAIMYLATEGLYAEIVSSSSGILEKIQNECNVMVAGPSTITALLNSLSMGFKTVAMALKEDSLRIDDPRLAAEEKLAIVMGTEGDGLDKRTLADCDYTAIIPMFHGVDSLNVAAASAVAFWELAAKGR